PWESLHAAGYRLVGLAPSGDGVPLREALGLLPRGPLALVAGNEGSGLSDEALEACDVRACIPMHGGADSLNVATAVALALYEAGIDRDGIGRDGIGRDGSPSRPTAGKVGTVQRTVPTKS